MGLYNLVYKAIFGITEKMLIQSLKELEKDTIVKPKITVKDDGMSMDFIGTLRKKKTPKYYLILWG